MDFQREAYLYRDVIVVLGQVLGTIHDGSLRGAVLSAGTRRDDLVLVLGQMRTYLPTTERMSHIAEYFALVCLTFIAALSRLTRVHRKAACIREMQSPAGGRTPSV